MILADVVVTMRPNGSVDAEVSTAAMDEIAELRLKAAGGRKRLKIMQRGMEIRICALPLTPPVKELLYVTEIHIYCIRGRQH